MFKEIALGIFYIVIIWVGFQIYNKFIERDKYIEETSIEKLCPEYENTQTRFMPAKCIEYFSGKDNKWEKLSLGLGI